MRGMGRLFLRGEIWWLTLMLPDPDNSKVKKETPFSSSIHSRRHRGVGIRGGAPGKPPKEAVEWQIEMLYKKGRGVPLDSEKLTLDNVLDQCEEHYRGEMDVAVAKAEANPTYGEAWKRAELAKVDYIKCRKTLAAANADASPIYREALERQVEVARAEYGKRRLEFAAAKAKANPADREVQKQAELAKAAFDRCRLAFVHLKAENAFGGWLLSNVTKHALEQYINRQRLSGKSQNGKIGRTMGGINLDFTYLKKALQRAVDNNMLEKLPPMPVIKHRNEGNRSGIILDETFRSIVAELSPSYYVMPVWFLRYAPVRRNEACGLEWESVSFAEEQFVLHPCLLQDDNKRKRRAISFRAHPHLRRLLEVQRTRVDRLERTLGRKITWVFCDDKGEQLSQRALTQAWITARERAGATPTVQRDGRLRPPTVHDLRRTNLSIVAAVVPTEEGLEVAQSGAGHADVATTQLYIYTTRAQADKVQEAVAKVTPDWQEAGNVVQFKRESA